MPQHNWTGFYAGANAGAALSQNHATTDNFLGGGVDLASSNFSGGVQAGYNWQVQPNWVAGAEADFGRLGIDRANNSFDQVEFATKASWFSTLRARFGYSTGPALLYVTGGPVFVNIKNRFDDINESSASKSKTTTGWAVGGGIEAALTNNWSAKTEYLYVNAGSLDVTNPDVFGGTTAHFDNRFHVYRFGLNYKFGS